MVQRLIEVNAAAIAAELMWLGEVLEARLRAHLDHASDATDIRAISPPVHEDDGAPYAVLVRHYELDFDSRLVLALCMAPHVRPDLLDVFFLKNSALGGRGHTEFGGLAGQEHSGFLPTGETALFLLAGDNLADRMRCLPLLDGRHVLIQHGVLRLEPSPPGEPLWSGQLRLAQEYADCLIDGFVRPPAFGDGFPARRLVTGEEWCDLVLEPDVMQQVKEISAWIRHGETVMHDFGLARRMKPGFRALFYGPPGTGKTMTAGLLGKESGRDVYRIDLSMVVSKYVGETEKNLARVFDRATGRDWILFFDEAEALFGKRTSVKDARDRFANQQVAYLLQRVEEYDGVVILASNLRDHIDEAFTRRFHSIIHFPMPDAAAREKLWRQSVPSHVEWEATIDFRRLAQEHTLSGAAIMNVVRFASLMAVERDGRSLMQASITRGVRRELQKEGRSS